MGRVSIITSVDGVGFDEAWSERFAARYADQAVFVISQSHLIPKTAAGRPQDLGDVDALERLGN